MAETAVVKAGQQAVAVSAPTALGNAGDSVHDYALRPPILKLVQAQSADGTPGNYRRTDNGEEFESIDVIPLHIKATRLKYPGGEYSRDRKPMCWSNDGLHGAPGSSFDGQDCLTCQFRLNTIWDAEPNTEMCLPTHAVIFLDAYSFEPLLFQINNKSTARIAPIVRANLRKARMSLFIEDVKGNTGRFFAPRMKTIEKLDEDDMAQINEVLAMLGEGRISTDMVEEEPEAQPPAAKVDEDPDAALVDSFTEPVMPLETERGTQAKRSYHP